MKGCEEDNDCHVSSTRDLKHIPDDASDNPCYTGEEIEMIHLSTCNPCIECSEETEVNQKPSPQCYSKSKRCTHGKPLNPYHIKRPA